MVLKPVLLGKLLIILTIVFGHLQVDKLKVALLSHKMALERLPTIPHPLF